MKLGVYEIGRQIFLWKENRESSQEVEKNCTHTLIYYIRRHSQNLKEDERFKHVILFDIIYEMERNLCKSMLTYSKDNNRSFPQLGVLCFSQLSESLEVLPDFVSGILFEGTLSNSHCFLIRLNNAISARKMVKKVMRNGTPGENEPSGK